mgnify:CR=1 FL=1
MSSTVSWDRRCYKRQKEIENSLSMFNIDAWASVTDNDAGFVAGKLRRGGCRNLDVWGFVRKRELQRVRHEILQRLNQPPAVPQDDRQLVYNHNRSFGFFDSFRQNLQNGADDFAEVNRFGRVNGSLGAVA